MRADSNEEFAAFFRAQLRSHMKRVRNAVPAETRVERSEKAVRNLLAIPPFSGPVFSEPKTVASYVACKSELRTASLHDALWEQGRVLLFPRTHAESKELSFHRVAQDTMLETGPFGTLQPSGQEVALSIARADCVVLPALAVDEQGHRLGYGQGYYDRALQDFAGPKVALIFDFQLVMEVPAGTWDVPVDWIVTDERVIQVASLLAR